MINILIFEYLYFSKPLSYKKISYPSLVFNGYRFLFIHNTFLAIEFPEQLVDFLKFRTENFKT